MRGCSSKRSSRLPSQVKWKIKNFNNNIYLDGRNNIIPEFENERLLIELECQKRHENEIEEFKEKAKTHNSYKFRPSPDLLNLQRQTEAMKSNFINETFVVSHLNEGSKIANTFKEVKKMKKKVKRMEKLERNKHKKSTEK